MRRDMAMLLVERPRLGSGEPTRARLRAYDRKSRTRDGDESPPRSMSMRFAPSKTLNENLKPLERFLEARRGRPWDEVYAEIRQHLAPRSAVDMHILQHLWQYVLFTRRLPDGKVVLLDQHGAIYAELRPDRSIVCRYGAGRQLYVCCDSGILRVAVRKKRRKSRVLC